MKITVDTNVLVRISLLDDLKQARIAKQLFRQATLIAIPTACLCELVWILKQGEKLPNQDIVFALKKLLNIKKVSLNRPAVEAGIRLLEQGGDFADAVMEYEGTILGGETFYSFDKKAIRLLKEQGKNVQLLES